MNPSNRSFKPVPGSLRLLSLALAAGLFAAGLASAAPPAGTVIGNQAAATYTDASAVSRTATSNTVTTVVQQVGAFTLTAAQTKIASPGAPISFAHTFTNTGNGNDSFTLAAVNNSGDNFDLTGLAIYADATCDGVADNATAITSIGPVSTGGTACVVVTGTVPGSATTGQSANFSVNAVSVFNPAITQTNLDTVNVSGNAVINVSKSINSPSGSPGSGPYTYTLTYTNNGNSNATNLVLADLIPSGVSYVTGSARWSGSGATALTDGAAPADPAGITYDFGVTSAGAVTAVIATVPANASGTLTFQVNVSAAQGPGVINNTARVCYNDGATQQPTGCTPANTVSTGTPTNTAPFTVNQSAAVNGNGSSTDSTLTSDPAAIASAAQGSTISFNNYVWNRGNGADSFDITIPSIGSAGNNFPSGTTFQLFKSDGVTPLVDTNGNGTPDTGAIPPANGATCTPANGFVADTTNAHCGFNVVLRITLPAAATGGPFSVSKSATSRFDGSKTDVITDTLTAVTSSTVDLRNGAANTAGSGTGPEASPVTTQSVNPGGSTSFVLQVNNTSAVADTYNLVASTDNTFASTTLPAGWSVSFRVDGGGSCATLGSVVTNTGIVNAGANATFCAVVSVPTNAAAVPAPGTSIFFRAQSPTTSASDRKHDAVIVNTLRSLTMTPNNSGQVFPGGSVVFAHTITNSGNVVEGVTTGQAVLSNVQTGATAGWSGIVYWDRNNDGVLDASDPIVSDLAQLVGGSGGASTAAGLNPAESARLFVKVLAPAAAPIGAVNIDSLTATITGSINGVAAPAAVTVTDTTTVIAGQVRLVKEQALDANCDGTPETAYTQSSISTGAVPGACIRYRVTATNDGTADVTSLVVSDATPANTTYHTGGGTAPAASTVGVVTAPALATAGTVQVTIATLVPAQSAVLTFGVRIDP